MKVTEVTESDIRMLHQLSSLLVSGDFKVVGKDLVKNGDAARWMQGLAQEMARSFSEQKTSKEDIAGVEKPAPAPASEGIPLAGTSDVKIKSFHPGKPGKK